MGKFQTLKTSKEGTEMSKKVSFSSVHLDESKIRSGTLGNCLGFCSVFPKVLYCRKVAHTQDSSLISQYIGFFLGTHGPTHNR